MVLEVSQLTQEAAEPHTDEPSLDGKMLLLYDGVCGFCNRIVQFTLERDKRDLFRFAPIQGKLAHRILRRHGFDPKDLDTVYLVENVGQQNEKPLRKSRAVLKTFRELGGFWAFSSLARFLPRKVTDWGYDFVAKRRYGLFGKHDSCPLPTQEQRKRFVGMELAEEDD
jgi:predicted DCC family thiol-disulfide oxidoreductase YuxK